MKPVVLVQNQTPVVGVKGTTSAINEFWDSGLLWDGGGFWDVSMAVMPPVVLVSGIKKPTIQVN